MARKDLELELLSLRFKYYTHQVRQCISRIVVSERCEDTSDTVIDGLWKICRDDLSSLLSKGGIVDDRFDKPDHPGLDVEAREFIRTFIDQARSYEAELADLEDDDFEAVYRAIINPIIKAKRDRREQSAREKDRWEFFNKPDADADFARWRDRLLSAAQAVALSFGKDPDVVKPERLTPYRKVGGSPFREAFKDRLDLIEGAIAAGNLSVPMSVSSLDRWALGCGINLPAALTGKEAPYPGADANFWKRKYESAQAELDSLRTGIDDLPPKSKISIYKLLIGMAVARFEHRTDQRTKSTSNIREGLRDAGLSMDDEAILDHLRGAAAALDYKWTTPISWTRFKKPQS